MPGNQTPRPFVMLDAMILIAATAIGLSQASQVRVRFVDWTDITLITMVSMLPVVSMACFVLRLRQPRPPLNKLFNQPGISACLAGGGPAVFLHLLARWDSSRFLSYVVVSIFVAGPAVVVTWAIQMFAEEMKAEPSWVDRLGVGLGFAWVGLLVLFVVLLNFWF